MNQAKITLAITAIVAAAALTTVAFAVPQQVMAWGHHYYHHNSSNSIRVNQEINQLNACTNQSFCANSASNSADIHH
jgi:hypothetical protein